MLVCLFYIGIQQNEAEGWFAVFAAHWKNAKLHEWVVLVSGLHLCNHGVAISGWFGMFAVHWKNAKLH